jgi:hypothetical protein
VRAGGESRFVGAAEASRRDLDGDQRGPTTLSRDIASQYSEKIEQYLFNFDNLNYA